MLYKHNYTGEGDRETGGVSLLQDSSRILNVQDALQIHFIITLSANIKYIYTQPLRPTPITLPFTFYVGESFLSAQITLLMITLCIETAETVD